MRRLNAGTVASWYVCRMVVGWNAAPELPDGSAVKSTAYANVPFRSRTEPCASRSTSKSAVQRHIHSPEIGRLISRRNVRPCYRLRSKPMVGSPRRAAAVRACRGDERAGRNHRVRASVTGSTGLDGSSGSVAPAIQQSHALLASIRALGANPSLRPRPSRSSSPAPSSTAAVTMNFTPR